MLKAEKAQKMKEEGMADVKMPDGQTLQLPVLSVSGTQGCNNADMAATRPQ